MSKHLWPLIMVMVVVGLCIRGGYVEYNGTLGQHHSFILPPAYVYFIAATILGLLVILRFSPNKLWSWGFVCLAIAGVLAVPFIGFRSIDYLWTDLMFKAFYNSGCNPTLQQDAVLICYAYTNDLQMRIVAYDNREKKTIGADDFSINEGDRVVAVSPFERRKMMVFDCRAIDRRKISERIFYVSYTCELN